MVRDAIAAGAGAAMLPQSIIGNLLAKGELVTWGIAGDEVELWVLHTSRRLQSPKVCATNGSRSTVSFNMIINFWGFKEDRNKFLPISKADLNIAG